MYKYVLIAATALSFAACTNEEIDTSPPGEVALEVNADISGTQTRASGDEWDTGDEIGISCTSGSATYTNIAYVTVHGDGNFTASSGAIYFQNSEEVAFTAYYPWKESLSASTSYSFDTKDQSTQKEFDFLYTTGATASKSNPAVSFTGDYAFKHCMSQITLEFAEGKDVDLSGSFSYTLGGLKMEGTFTYDSEEGVAATSDDATAEPLTITLGENETKSSVILFPQEVETISLSVALNGQTYTANLTPTSNELQAGHNYTWKVTVSKTELEINNATIKDWVVANEGEEDVTVEL